MPEHRSTQFRLKKVLRKLIRRSLYSTFKNHYSEGLLTQARWKRSCLIHHARPLLAHRNPAPPTSQCTQINSLHTML